MLILETERLFLRKFELIDAPFILELLNTPTWLQFIGDKGVRNLDDAENYLKNGSLKSYEENGFGFYLVGEKSTQKPIGMCGFIKRQELEDVDLGFAFLPDYIGKGFGYEIAKAILKYGKDVLKLSRIIAIVDPRNTASNALLQKLGFVFEKTIPFGEKKDLLNLYGI
ncbi:N-acetyltransferase [Lacihabitans sp. CCS-44]|uniref:GNAT family N-acetyltransferase n=1 Tax=Lacihabitans sp. CCS-44 TaxID=2487331 RepID=UPI0020CEA418|nr:GNAT family N-acetyltransferase [Lacihabitans sp. CCS-44]MCP9753868.1 N-acetyltransferase [Lacihabitans sp. CCS-44]